MLLFAYALIISSASAVLPESTSRPTSPPRSQKSTFPLAGMASLDCSGVVVRLGREDFRSAVILTNGHCTTPLHTSIPRGKFQLGTHYIRSLISIYDSGGHSKYVRPLKVLYATMTDTDLALIEIQPTYEELTRDGVKIYEVSRNEPNIADEVSAISGFWRDEFKSRVAYIVPELTDDGSVWRQSIALEGRDRVRAGWSGSPLVSTVSGEVVAVLNSYAANVRDCRKRIASCERFPDGTERVSPGRAYAQQVTLLWDCLREGNIDLTQTRCKLPGHR